MYYKKMKIKLCVALCKGSGFESNNPLALKCKFFKACYLNKFIGISLGNNDETTDLKIRIWIFCKKIRNEGGTPCHIT